jgi:hypothetical protein
METVTDMAQLEISNALAMISAIEQNLLVRDVRLVGSEYIMGEGSGNDVDLLVWVHDVDKYARLLVNDGWEQDTSYERSVSLRLGKWNLLVEQDGWRFNAIRRAAEVCYYLHEQYGMPMNRVTRVAIHKIIRDGMEAKEAHDEAVEQAEGERWDALVGAL